MKIYFSAPIDGVKGDESFNTKIISHLKKYGEVTSELFYSEDYRKGESPSPKDIHDKDIAWVEEADVIVAEVSTPSLGVGYEIKHALHKDKKVLCLWKNVKNKRLSLMITGAPGIDIIRYNDQDHAIKEIDNFFLQSLN